jgi:hypothetical protein
MYTLSWSNGFRCGFKKATRKDPSLQEKIFSFLEKLSIEPFDPVKKQKRNAQIQPRPPFPIVNFQRSRYKL